MSKQILQQSQKQTISFQQIQFFKMLEISQDDLEQKIQKEVEENPALEEIIEDNNQKYFYKKTNNKEEDSRIEIPESKQNLNDYVLEQLEFEELNKKEKNIAEFIIGSLDESGYLKSSCVEIKNDLFVNMNIDVQISEIKKIIKKIQKLEPKGIGASNLQECLLLQINEKDSCEITEVASKIIEYYFNDFVQKNYEKIIKKLQIKKDIIKKAELEIKKLSPKPGSAFEDYKLEKTEVFPDLILIKKNDSLKIELTKEKYYDLKISKSFSEILNNKKENKEATAFVKEKLEKAQTFIENLNKRNIKLLKTAKAIVSIQKLLFETGDMKNIVPMKLEDIQKITNDHLSAISRIVNKKYIETHFGIFKLKSFFSVGFLMTNGEEISPKKIKEEIKDIIKNENHHKPYKDEEISEVLNKKQIIVSRRTITKYRKQLKILHSKLRKKI